MPIAKKCLSTQTDAGCETNTNQGIIDFGRAGDSVIYCHVQLENTQASNFNLPELVNSMFC